MCQANNRYIFCSCVDKNEDPATDELTVYYTWYLVRYLGSRESNIRGKIMMPKKDLGNGITLDVICKQLNSDVTTFDFDYEPSERDCLQLEIAHPTERFRYFKLIFMDGQWTEGANNVFTSITEKIASGTIKRHTSSSQDDQWVTNTKETIEILFEKLLATTESQKQWEYIAELAKRKPETSFHKGHVLITSNSYIERLIGTRIFVKLYDSDYKSDKIMITFFDLLKSEEEEEIISLILSVIGYDNKNFSEQQIEFLCKFKTYRADVKLSLIDVFRYLENDTVIDVFIELSIDKNAGVRREAISSLGDLTEVNNVKIGEALWNSVQDINKEVRHTAILALSERKNEDIKALLLKELETIDGQGHLILDAIENLNDQSFIPHIEFQIEKHKNTANYLTELLQRTLDYLNSIA
ncbi:hypothetical protein [uncultured Kordia sp.]|uniref:hypothetical protein n=1 Tax=uncultured Kordia sp. TaxID=507699 RepID=UPI00261D3126|nr:hypothetical protein [uncultured Kordia sp.]